jgi:hypothetical protein
LIANLADCSWLAHLAPALFVNMPYTGADDPKLPSNVRKLPEKKRSQWVQVWNTTYKACQKEGGSDCEGKAFRTANGVIKKGGLGMPDGVASEFIYVDLSAYSGRPFDGLASGTFTDMWGQEVKITEADLELIARNTSEAIQFTKTEGGEVVGLPIDASNHNRGDAAGWIVECSNDPAVKRIRLTPNWTEEGLTRIGKGLQRFFSATIDLSNKVILGGTLTNWPATRDGKNNILLRPIELSAPMFTFQEGVNDMTENVVQTQEVDLDALRASIVGEIVPPIKNDILSAVAELMKPAEAPKVSPVNDDEDLIKMFELEGMKEEVMVAMRDRLVAQVEAVKTQAALETGKMLAALQHESRVADFCQKVVSGTQDNPYGLPIDEKALSAFLLSLDSQKAKTAMGLLESIWKNGRVTFAELGHNQDIKIVTLPAEVVAALNAGQLTVSDLDAPSLALGDLSQYDLSKWQK